MSRLAAFLIPVLATTAAWAGPFVSPGPFVPVVPGGYVPPPRQVSGKEYSNRIVDPSGVARDWDDAAVADSGQSLWFDGLGGITDAIDYDTAPRFAGGMPGTNVDAQANRGDALFEYLIGNASHLLFSTAGDGNIYVERRDPVGGPFVGVWASPAQVDQHFPAGLDVDSLEVHGVDGPALADADAFLFSLEGDAGLPGGPRVSVWDVKGTLFPGGVVFTAAEIASAIGRPDLAGAIDLDAMIVRFPLDPASGLPAPTAGVPAIVFSIAPLDVFDGGEIWVWDGVTPGGATFLWHGGHFWNTAFDVAGATGAGSENVDALEVISTVPEPSTLALLGAGVLGLATLRRRRRPSRAGRAA